jgi:hypothetical protein
LGSSHPAVKIFRCPYINKHIQKIGQVYESNYLRDDFLTERHQIVNVEEDTCEECNTFFDKPAKDLYKVQSMHRINEILDIHGREIAHMNRLHNRRRL